MKKVLVTGAGGFVGTALCSALEEAGHAVRRAGREDDWETAPAGADAVVHLAGRAHVPSKRSADSLAAFRRDNVELTERIARAAARVGVRRFVFASTARVSGPGSGEHPLRESDPPAPAEPYARSKLEAERVLRAVEAGSSLEVTVLRIPLVYGPGVKGNFLALLRAVDRGLPLPLGAIRNRRSFVYVGNLASAFLACVEHPAAAGRVFNVSDDENISTPELVRRLAAALDRAQRLFAVPPALLRLAGRIAGRGEMIERLCASFELDITAIREALGWRPPFSMAQGLAATARWYRAADL